MTEKYSRREAIEMGLGAVMMGTAGRLVAATGANEATKGQEETIMTKLAEFNGYGEELERQLIMRSSPIAVKMLEKESDIPEGAVRPKKDRGYHLAQCQAFAMSRREGTCVAMFKEDHWCPTAPMAYGFVERPESIEKWTHPYDCFERGKYAGIVSAPLKTANFMPDVVLMYLNPAKLRALLLTMPVGDVPSVSGHFFPPSCGWAVVNPILTKQLYVVVPDPGEYQRALTEEGDMMLSVPGGKMPALMAGLKQNEHGMFSYREHTMFMQPDFDRPDFYKDLFKDWGLE
jgi:uncharacterized protein (DUF169 family)